MIIALAATLAVLSPPAFAVDRNVTFINQTGRDIEFLGFNPPGDEAWDDNEISDVFGDGDTEYVKFNQADRGCVWNIKTDWADDNSSVRLSGVDLCTISNITLHYDPATGEASYTTE
jgi:hypothetical protein